MSSWSKGVGVRPKPSVTLVPGQLPYWNDRTSKREPGMYYLTVATKPHPVLTVLQARMDSIGETLTVLGKEVNRPIGWNISGNFGIKLKTVVDFLKNPSLDPMDVIFFSDAYDVAYVGSQAAVLAAFATFTKPVVFGAEKLCSPDATLANRYPPISGSTAECGGEFRFLNSGGYIGRVWALRQLMADYVYVDSINDQAYWTAKFLDNQDLIELDYTNKIFLNCVDLDKKEIIWDGARVYYREAMPLLIHANGVDKSYIDPMIGLD
jgi:hypothetical protein